MRSLKSFLQYEASERECQIATSRVPRNDNLLGLDIVIVVDFVDKEPINFEAVHGSRRKPVLWWHPIVDRENRDPQISGPSSGVDLHGTARKSQEAATMHVQDNGLNVLLGLRMEAR